MREGTLFEFASVGAIVSAAGAARAMGATRLDAYTPFAIPALDAKLGIARTRIPRAVFVASIVGCVLAFGILWGTSAYDYPLDVGGRPLNSLPADVPILFETTVLFGCVTAFLSMLLRCGLPRLHRAVFEVDGIERASVDRFFLGIEHEGQLGDAVHARMLAEGALAVHSLRPR